MFCVSLYYSTHNDKLLIGLQLDMVVFDLDRVGSCGVVVVFVSSSPRKYLHAFF